MIHIDLPSGRSGSLDGLPSGKRVAAIWLDDAADGTPTELLDGYPVGCIYHDSHRCSVGRRVLIYDICDMTGTAVTPIVCPAHAASRYGVMPHGEPTPSYTAAVTADLEVLIDDADLEVLIAEVAGPTDHRPRSPRRRGGGSGFGV